MKVLIGLGNPGKRYELTRHNLGFWCIAMLAKRHGISIKSPGLWGRGRKLVAIGEGQIANQQVVLATPKTFMNASGSAVKYLQARFRVRLEDLLIVYDEMDLPIGKVRLGPKGSAGGHRGMTSVIENLGTQSIPRLRIGVGRPPGDVDPIPYLLSEAVGDEYQTLEQASAYAADVIDSLVSEGLEYAMSRFN